MVSNCKNMEHAFAQIPSGLFVLTSRYESTAAGVIVQWVQRCSLEPPMVMVGMQKGHMVEPLIRDSKAFGLCQLAAGDRFLQRKFATMKVSDDGQIVEDQFMGVVTRCAVTGSPIIDRAISYLDCELARNVELECEYRLFVGHVLGGGILRHGSPAICIGANGTGGR
jgi:flavin reductase (DIM6/NTAB) family NADH-FMN oxidoreductase RutF